jgi:hypothetical protein
MPMSLIGLLLLQAARVATPGAEAEWARIEQDLKAMPELRGTSRRSTAAAPALVDDARSPSITAVLKQGQMLQSMVPPGTKSAIAAIDPAIISAHCKRVFGNPAGQQRMSDGRFNGYVSFIRCPDYVVVVEDFDYRSATAPSVIDTLPAAAIDGTMNGGSFAKTYYRNARGDGHINVSWLGRSRSMTVSIYGDARSMAAMDRIATDAAARITAAGGR